MEASDFIWVNLDKMLFLDYAQLKKKKKKKPVSYFGVYVSSAGHLE